MKNRNFFAELKRRNVYKVAVAYLVSAWLIQAASIFLPAFHAPDWTMQIVILILVIGFPIALISSWAFEITPEVYTWCGEKEAALELLEKSVTLPTGITYGEPKQSPDWDSLRGDPRFERIVASLDPKNAPATK